MSLSDMIESQRYAKINEEDCESNSPNDPKGDDSNKSTHSSTTDRSLKYSRSNRQRSRSKDKSSRRRSRSDKRRSRSSRRSRSGGRSSRSHRRSRSSRNKRSKSRSYRRKSRSSSRSYRRRDASRRRDRRRSRNRDESPRRRRSDSRSKCYAPDVKEVQEKFTDDEKDARTIYVWQLSQRVRTRDLEDLFSTVGKLCVVRLILDPRSGKSKGVAYIQFRNVETVDKALRLTGTKLLGFPIMIRTVSSEKCRAAEASMVGGGINLKGPTKLCISNLHPIITEKNLEEIFSPYGLITGVQLLHDINGNSSGTAFVTFQKGENAKVAMDQLNEFVLAQRPMKISPVTENNFGSELNESVGVSMTSTARLGLMAKLAVGTGLQMTPCVKTDEKSIISTQCFVLSNMFDLQEINDEEICKEIEEDVTAECSRFGGILHIHIDKKGPSGNVYVKCPTVPIASQCVNSMHGRSFDGRIVKASYIPLTNYSTMFPESAHLTKILKC